MLEIVEVVEGPLVSHLNLAELTHNEPFSILVERVCGNATKQTRAALEKATLSKMLKR